ncbi:MAG: GC-type dockerin domain-anchored protein [Phycisphaerales bacterium JB059]
MRAFSLWRSVVICVALAATQTNADVHRVDLSAPPGGDGSSWARAFDSLTDGLAAASSGDQVWISKGTYTPETPAGRDATFNIPDGVQVYGGFEGNESSLSQRGDPLDPPAVLSGRLPSGLQTYSVVTLNAVGPGTILDGVMICDGLADGAGGARSNGAGIYADDSAPTLRNLVISDCVAGGAGGGIYLGGASADFANIADCRFLENTCGQTGGAMLAYVSTTVQRCEFIANTAPSGGAIRFIGIGVNTVDDCFFRRNEATGGSGPAIYTAMSAGSFTFTTNSEFRENSGLSGGALEIAGQGDHAVRSCRFFANQATNAGAGAIDFDAFAPGPRLAVEISLFTGNTCTGGVGAILNAGEGELNVINCTIAMNTSTGLSGGVLATGGQTFVNNTIIWGNDSTSQSGQYDSIRHTGLAVLWVNHTIIQGLGVGGTPLAGVNTSGNDPLFTDIEGADNTPGTTDDNARLSPGSPAIDGGFNLYLDPATTLDIHNAPRYADDIGTPDTGTGDGVNPVVDLGAAEFQGVTPFPCSVADQAEPYHVLDFSDVVTFLGALDAMDPAADLAPPIGVFDFSDLVEYLAAFGAGCP